MDNDILQESAADQQPGGYMASITDGTLLRNPLFICVHVLAASNCNMRKPNKEFAQHQAQPADHLAP